MPGVDFVGEKSSFEVERARNRSTCDRMVCYAFLCSASVNRGIYADVVVTEPLALSSFVVSRQLWLVSLALLWVIVCAGPHKEKYSHYFNFQWDWNVITAISHTGFLLSSSFTMGNVASRWVRNIECDRHKAINVNATLHRLQASLKLQHRVSASLIYGSWESSCGLPLYLQTKNTEQQMLFARPMVTRLVKPVMWAKALDLKLILLRCSQTELCNTTETTLTSSPNLDAYSPAYDKHAFSYSPLCCKRVPAEQCVCTPRAGLVGVVCLLPACTYMVMTLLT